MIDSLLRRLDINSNSGALNVPRFLAPTDVRVQADDLLS